MGGKSGGGKSLVGYRYRLTMQTALCHGPIDAIRSIWFGDKEAWRGDMRRAGDHSQIGVIDNPGLFGGEDSEGGVSGHFELGCGTTNQVLVGVNADGTTDPQAYVAVAPGSPAPAWAPEMGTHYRGVAVLNFLRFYFGMNPYLKEIAVEAERYWDGWFPEVRQIGADTNPAHIIYESITSGAWGLGYARETIDDSSFRRSAQRLYDEGFGLSLLWSEQQSIEDFIDHVKEMIDATFYLNTRTGLWTLRLIREGDPVVARIHPGNAKLQGFKRRALGETINELNVKWVLPETEDFVSLTIHDQANIEAQGQVVSGTQEYAGIRSEALAARVGQRDLQAAAATLAEAQVEGNRSLWDVYPGDVVEFAWPPYGITSIQCRVTSTTHASAAGSGIKLDLVEDVFGQVSGVFSGGNTIGWEDTRTVATLFSPVVPWEIPYWFVQQALNGVSVSAEATYGAVLPVTDNPGVRQAVLYATHVRPSGTVFALEDRGAETTSGLLGAPLPLNFRSTLVLPFETMTGSRALDVDPFIVIGEGVNAEIARIEGSALFNGEPMQIVRGLMDTHIRRWPIGTRVYLIDDDGFLVDSVARSMFETVEYKATMQTSISVMDVEEVPAVELTTRGRQGRPYPPQNVRIGGAYWPASVTAPNGMLTVTWATRNRLLQDADIQVLWNAGNVVSEAGTTYVCRVLQGGTEVASVETGEATAVLDISGANEGEMTVEVFSVRDDLESYQTFTHTFDATIPIAQPVQASNPGSWPIPANGALTKLPLYTKTSDPNTEFSTSSSTFTPKTSGNYRVEAQISPVVSGTGAFTPGSTFRLGFDTVAVDDSKVVRTVAPAQAAAFSLALDDSYALIAGTPYFLFVSQSGPTGVRMTSANLKISKVS